MNLYPHDCSYLNTEYGRRKEMESYEIENRRDDGKQEGNEYTKAHEKSHDELLAVCRRVLSFLHVVPLGTGNDHELIQCLIALKNAIARAEK